jgi:hypothetical protein
LGQLRISKLRQTLLNIKTVETSALHHQFFHWELAFADIFSGLGGFDLVLGNPPWLKIEWNESGILGEVNPKVAIRRLNATEITKIRNESFKDYHHLKKSWLQELEQSEAVQNFLNADQNYYLLKGVQTNLYKCFLPIGWSLMSASGVMGMLYPIELYDDPKG